MASGRVPKISIIFFIMYFLYVVLDSFDAYFAVNILLRQSYFNIILF